MKKNITFIFLAALFVFSCSRERPADIQGMIYIPEGEFIMGSVEEDKEGLGREFGLRAKEFYIDERPIRRIMLKGFYMDKYEVTNKEYKEFVNSTGYSPPPAWKNGTYELEKENYPVNNVTWYDANAYCVWAGKRLPTEEEWEKASRGPKGNKYPWGEDYDAKKANLDTGKIAAAGSYPDDKSYYGVYDMGGNVMEWIDAWYEPYTGYPYDAALNKDFGKQSRVLRGGVAGVTGHYLMNKIYARGAARRYYLPGGAGDDGGFRCAKSMPAILGR